MKYFQPIYLLAVSSILFEILISKPLFAREIVYGKSKKTLSISFGVETLFRFPMEVKTITEAHRFEIKPASLDEPDYSVLVVKPRMKEGVSDVTFILADSSVIRTQLVISNRSHFKKDSIYDFKPEEESHHDNPNLSEKRVPFVITELDLMRAMLGGQTVLGFEVTKVHEKVKLENSDSISVTLIKTYVRTGIHGLIYLLETNQKKEKQKIELDQLTLGQPNLALLSQVDHPTIGGKTQKERQTLLRIVAKPGASTRKIILPTALESLEKL